MRLKQPSANCRQPASSHFIPCYRRYLPLGLIFLILVLLLLFPNESNGFQTAYVGPGAGIALVGSFLAVLFALLSAFFTLLTWPIRWIWRSFRSRRALARAKTDRVVILGLDGLDPEIKTQMSEFKNMYMGGRREAFRVVD